MTSPKQELFVFVRPEVIPRPDGCVLLRPGRPVKRLTPAQFGAQVGLSADSIYRYIAQGMIEERFITYAGHRKIYIDAEAIDRFLERSRLSRVG